ncbi:MAG: hypothetical protein QM703_13615 [Gemmatales bacterium]
MRKQIDPYVSLPGESLASQAMKALASELIQLHNHLAQQKEDLCPSQTLELFSDAADAAYLDRKTSVATLLSRLGQQSYQLALHTSNNLGLNIAGEALKVAHENRIHEVSAGEFSG